jgi:hypothetical protein
MVIKIVIQLTIRVVKALVIICFPWDFTASPSVGYMMVNSKLI